ncbi:MAG: T9SS type A sorting domain-containing protein [Bacteroidales bacterium]|nr:T9SS type A sorting domain-containing protein [Bacteroidales bacterium]
MKKIDYILYFLICFNLPVNAQLICFDFPADVFSTPGVPTTITAADFNWDNFDDLAIGHYNEEFISIMINDGTGHFPGIITYPIGGNAGTIVAEDINVDGIIDLLVMGRFYDIYIFTGNGDGNFTLASVLWTDFWSSDAEMIYFDEDNNIDLAVIDQIHHKVRILLGNGTGFFQLNYMCSTFGYVPRRMAKGDFNEDGNDDLVICNVGMPEYIGFNVVLFEGTGEGSFQSPVILYDEYIPESVVSGDFNLDGYQDIIFKQYDRNLVKLWGKGDGTFQEPEIQEISAIYYAIYLHEVDINLDGALDLAMGCYTFNMHINDGSGYFSDTLYINEKSNSYRIDEITTGNFNGDAKPDVVSTHSNFPDLSYGSITVYLNCLPVGIPDDKFPDDRIVLHPNPGNGYLRISSDPSLADAEVTGIFNCLGIAIDESQYSLSGQYLDLSSLKPGLYIIHFINGNNTICKKVIIN